MTNLKYSAVALFILMSSVTKADVIDNAYIICNVLDNTGSLSEECKVSGWNQSIDASIDTSAIEAKKICVGVAKLASKNNIKFDKDWKIRIYSPFSNGKTLATCPLPQK